jgi:hypothetical protein
MAVIRTNWDFNNDGDIEAAYLTNAPGGGALEIEDESVSLTTAVTKINFAGAGVTATEPVADEILVTIPGGGSGITTQDEGILVDATATTLNFVGAGVTATDAGSNVTTVTIPGGGGRELLTANRTYFVDPAGNDSNDGLTGGTPFLTIQKAIDTVAALDIDIYDVTIQLADGTYSITTALQLKDPIGAGEVCILGNTGTPANVIIDGGGTTNNLFAPNISQKYTVEALQGQAAVQSMSWNGSVRSSRVVFRDCRYVSTGSNIRVFYGALSGGEISVKSTFTLVYSSGTIDSLFQGLASNASVEAQSLAITITGSPAFVSALGAFDRFSNANFVSVSASGAFTGTGLDANRSSVILAMGSSGLGTTNTANAGQIHT